jgi:hypothetical protein
MAGQLQQCRLPPALQQLRAMHPVMDQVSHIPGATHQHSKATAAANPAKGWGLLLACLHAAADTIMVKRALAPSTHGSTHWHISGAGLCFISKHPCGHNKTTKQEAERHQPQLLQMHNRQHTL